MNSFKGKHIIITGASSGIGKALAIEFAGLGANLSICARNITALEQTAEDIRTLGRDCFSMKTDVSLQEECERFIATAHKHFGRIDILINNAGISMRAAFLQAKIEVLKKVMDVNYGGTLYCTRAALPYILDQGGSIVAVSSVSGLKGLPGRTAYSASKFAIHGLYESLRMEYLKKKLHVMIVCPGWTNTNIRAAALNAEGGSQAISPRNEEKMDSPKTVALSIIQGIRDKKYVVNDSLVGRKIKWLSKLFPNYVEQRIYKEMSKETGSPF